MENKYKYYECVVKRGDTFEFDIEMDESLVYNAQLRKSNSDMFYQIYLSDNKGYINSNQSVNLLGVWFLEVESIDNSTSTPIIKTILTYKITFLEDYARLNSGEEFNTPNFNAVFDNLDVNNRLNIGEGYVNSENQYFKILDSRDLEDLDSISFEGTPLGSEFYNLNYLGYGSLKTGWYIISTAGVNLSNTPFTPHPSAIYTMLIEIRNGELSFSPITAFGMTIQLTSNGDWDNVNKYFMRSGPTFASSISLGFTEFLSDNDIFSYGTSFPTNPRIAKTFFRTDKKQLYIYDSNKWLMVGGKRSEFVLSGTDINIEHGYGRYVNVTVIDEDGYEYECSIRHLDEDNITISVKSTSVLTGKAIIH